MVPPPAPAAAHVGRGVGAHSNAKPLSSAVRPCRPSDFDRAHRSRPSGVSPGAAAVTLDDSREPRERDGRRRHRAGPITLKTSGARAASRTAGRRPAAARLRVGAAASVGMLNAMAADPTHIPPKYDPSRLKVTFAPGTRADGPLAPRRYTLTHSDLTGDLFLTVGAEYDRRALRSLQVLLERDEVLGEWVLTDRGPQLDLHMTAQGGLPLFGTGAMRCRIFRRYRTMVVWTMRYGDRCLAEVHPEIDDAPVVARFHWRRGRIESEPWGRFGDRH